MGKCSQWNSESLDQPVALQQVSHPWGPWLMNSTLHTFGWSDPGCILCTDALFYDRRMKWKFDLCKLFSHYECWRQAIVCVLGTDGFKYFPDQDPATRKNMELHLDNLRMLGSLHHFEKDIILSPDLALHRKLDVGLPWRSFVELPRLQFPRMLNLGICARMGVHTQLVPWQEPGTSHANCGLRFCQSEEGPFFPRSFAPNRCFCFQSPSATLERECLDKVWRNNVVKSTRGTGNSGVRKYGTPDQLDILFRFSHSLLTLYESRKLDWSSMNFNCWKLTDDNGVDPSILRSWWYLRRRKCQMDMMLNWVWNCHLIPNNCC